MKKNTKTKRTTRRRKSNKRAMPRTSFAEPLVLMIALAVLIIIFAPYTYIIVPFAILLLPIAIIVITVMSLLSYPLGKKIREYAITNKKSDGYGVLLIIKYMILLAAICIALIILRGPQCEISFNSSDCKEIPYTSMIGACLFGIIIILLPALVNVTGTDSNLNNKRKTKKSSSKKNQDDFEEL
ncbi:hypothetical protein J6W91_00840 [Candidatus Saccharibacteria bacterium]|nr:hypothetical protein [Candidatus Saccharibacteria bacterium]